MTLPDYLCIGAQKAGTTWLFRNMRPHPEVFVAREKEVHYFDLNFHWSLHAYAARFRAAGGRIAGDFTPAYGVIPEERIRLIRCVMPDVRLILLLRHPVERAWSHALMELVHRPGVPYDSVPAEQFRAHFRSPQAIRKGDYDRMIGTWLRHFPEEQLLLVLNEDIADRPEEVMRRVFTHVGVSVPGDWSGYLLRERLGKSTATGTPLPDEFRRELFEIYADPLARLQARLGPLVSHWTPG